MNFDHEFEDAYDVISWLDLDYTDPVAAPPASTSFAFGASSRRVASYAGSRSNVTSVYFSDAAPAPVFTALVAQSPAVPYYEGARDQPRVAWGDSIVTDRIAPITQSRSVDWYDGSYSAVSAAADEDIGEWAQVTLNRPTPPYAAPRSRVEGIAALTPEVLDAWAQVTFGHATPYYQGPGAVTIPVFDPATNTFADWTPAALLSRVVENHSPPRSILVSPLAPAPGALADPYAPTTAARVESFYEGSYSWNASAASEPIIDHWVRAYQSRASKWYAPPAAFIARAYFEPAAVLGTEWTSVIQSRATPHYRAPRALITLGWDDHACTTLYPDTMLDPGTLLFPTLCPVLVTVQPSHNLHPGYYDAGPSLTIPVYAAAPIVFGADWAAAYQSNSATRPAEPLSRIVAPYFAGAEPLADTWAAAYASRRAAAYAAPRALVVPVYDQASRVSYAIVVQGRVVAYYDPQDSQFIYAYDGIDGSVNYPSAGGGGEFVNFRDPFRHNPFRDPFAKNPIRIKVPRGER